MTTQDIKNDFEDSIRGCIAREESPPTQLAIDKCLELVDQLNFSPDADTKVAGFAGEAGSAELSMHCFRTKRNVSFECFADGVDVEATTIDEVGSLKRRKVDLDDTKKLQELILWLKDD